ncbi:acyclic terpene utilization AtuA family protein [Pseudonocardia adelaidensis]|uniref:DUF1446 domain-containing protein n=1 Tax=Pseudonocardia adelaidensis TaxID=648754 RepID=A0ABP9NLT2_9PSEU
MTAPSRPIRIANCSGFYGDRLGALAEQVRGGEIDVVTGDYLAEVTMLVLAKAREKDPSAGYATTFLRQLEPVLSEVAERRIKVVVNAGGLNPRGLAEATRALLAQHGVALRVSWVEGDDVHAMIAGPHASDGEFAHLDTGRPLSSWGHDPLTANAYLGGFGIAAALSGGADIVITGRVADASLVVGPAAWWWGWTPDDHDSLAGAVVAGHVIECGAQTTGGNFSGFTGLTDLVAPGFPIAEVDADGSSVITKHPETPGTVRVDTVTAQLLYEIGAPAYANPDVVAHLDTVRLTTAGTDRVAVTAVRGSPPPATTKVSICAIGGWRNSATFVLTGLDVDAKAALVERAVREGLERDPGVGELRFQRIGVAVADPDDQFTGSCLLVVSATGERASVGRPFSSRLVELSLSSYPGIYGVGAPGLGGSYGVYWPTLIAQARVEHVVVHHDGRREPVPPPSRTVPTVAPHTGPRAGPAVTPPAGATRRVPLGAIAGARSGDKGGNANVGVWVGSDEAYGWLTTTMTTERLRLLLPETAALPVERHLLPNLRAVNFVIRGLLGGGATETLRFDKQAKALGEWLRSRHVDIPVSLLPPAG